MNNRPSCQGCSGTLGPDEQRRGRIVCFRCEDRASENLHKLAGPDGLYARITNMGVSALTPVMVVRDSGGGGSATRVHAQLPVNTNTLNLTGAGGVATTLQRWVVLWYNQLGFSEPRWVANLAWSRGVNPDGAKWSKPGRVDQAVTALVNNLPWASEKFTEFRVFSSTVYRLVEDCRQVVDPTEGRVRILVGRCPIQFDDGSICSVKMYVEPGDLYIKCHGCGEKWSRDRWNELAEYLRQ